MNARVRFDFREARRRRRAWVRRALAAACAVGASGAAAADLEWFDRHGAGHRPIALAEIVACADAVHAFDAGAPDAGVLAGIVARHGRHAAEYTAILVRSDAGEAGAATGVRLDAARGRFLAELRELLGDRPCGSELVALVAALDDARGACGHGAEPFVRVRRLVLRIASERPEPAVLAALAEALAACGRLGRHEPLTPPPDIDPLTLALAIEPLVPRLNDALGVETADELRRLVAASVVRGPEATIHANLAAILANADRLEAEVRGRLRDAVSDAAERLRQGVLSPTRTIAAMRDPALDEAEDRLMNGRPGRWSPEARAWRRLSARVDAAMRATFVGELGEDRARVLLALARGDLAASDGGDGNDAADAELRGFTGDDGFARLAARAEGAFWRPVQTIGEIGGSGEVGDPAGLHFEWTAELLAHMLVSPPDDAERAILEAILEAVLEDHRSRRRALLATLGSDALADALLEEGTGVLADMRAALPPERLSEPGVALVRLAGVEAGAALGGEGGLVLDTGEWLQGERPAVPLALLALGAPQRLAPPLPADARAALAEVLAGEADAMREAWLSDLRGFRARVAAAKARIAGVRAELQERARAMSARRAAGEIAGEIVDEEELTAYRRGLEEAGAEEARVYTTLVPMREAVLLAAWSRVLAVVERLRARADAGDAAAALAARAVTTAAFRPLDDAGTAGIRLGETLMRLEDGDLLRRACETWIAATTDASTPLVREIARCRTLQSADHLIGRGDLATPSRIARERIADSVLERERALGAAVQAWLLLREAGVPAARDAFRP